MKKKFIVSACLLGVKCKYNAGDNFHPLAKDLMKKGQGIPLCPEQLGGLTTPRDPAEIQTGVGEDVLLGKAKVVSVAGKDLTEAFIKGAKETLKLARLAGATGALLKDGSPSCGSSYIYDGSFQGLKKTGRGVTAALLKEKGLKIYSPKTFPKEKNKGKGV